MTKRSRAEAGEGTSVAGSPSQAVQKPIKPKALLLEKGMKLAEIDDDRFLDILREKNWLKLVDTPVRPNETLVKEFYKACVERNQEDNIYVRGKLVTISSSFINSYYHLFHVEQGIHNGLDVKVDKLTTLDRLRVYPNPSNTSNEVVYSELSVCDALLVNLLRSVVLPRKSASRLEQVEKLFLVCVKRGWKINMGELVLIHMTKLLENLKQFPNKQHHLYYPSLITGLLKDQGVPFHRKDVMAAESEPMGKVLMQKIKKSRGGKNTPEVGIPAQRRPRTEKVGGSSTPPVPQPSAQPPIASAQPEPSSVRPTMQPSLQVPEQAQPQPSTSQRVSTSEPQVHPTSVRSDEVIFEAINGITVSLKQEMQTVQANLERKIEEQVQYMCNQWKEEFLASIDDPFKFAEDWRKHREARLRRNDAGVSHLSPLDTHTRQSPQINNADLFVTDEASPIVHSPCQSHGALAKEFIPEVQQLPSPMSQIDEIHIEEVVEAAYLTNASSGSEISFQQSEVQVAIQQIRIHEKQGIQLPSTPYNQMVLYVSPIVFFRTITEGWVEDIPELPCVTAPSSTPVIHISLTACPCSLQGVYIQELPGAYLEATPLNQLVVHSSQQQHLQSVAALNSESSGPVPYSQLSSSAKEMLDQILDENEESYSLMQRLKVRGQQLHESSLPAELQDTASSFNPQLQAVADSLQEENLIPTPFNQLIVYLPPAEPLSMQPLGQEVSSSSDPSDVSGSSAEWPAYIRNIVLQARAEAEAILKQRREATASVSRPQVKGKDQKPYWKNWRAVQSSSSNKEVKVKKKGPVNYVQLSKGPVKISDAVGSTSPPVQSPKKQSRKRRRMIGEGDEPEMVVEELPNPVTVDVTFPYVQVASHAIESARSSKRTTRAAAKQKEVMATIPVQPTKTRTQSTVCRPKMPGAASTKEKKVAVISDKQKQLKKPVKPAPVLQKRKDPEPVAAAETSPPKKKRRKLVKTYQQSTPIADLMLTPPNPTLDTPPTRRRLDMARDELEPDASS